MGGTLVDLSLQLLCGLELFSSLVESLKRVLLFSDRSVLQDSVLSDLSNVSCFIESKLQTFDLATLDYFFLSHELVLDGFILAIRSSGGGSRSLFSKNLELLGESVLLVTGSISDLTGQVVDGGVELSDSVGISTGDLVTVVRVGDGWTFGIEESFQWVVFIIEELGFDFPQSVLEFDVRLESHLGVDSVDLGLCCKNSTSASLDVVSIVDQLLVDIVQGVEGELELPDGDIGLEGAILECNSYGFNLLQEFLESIKLVLFMDLVVALGSQQFLLLLLDFHSDADNFLIDFFLGLEVVVL